MVYVDSGVDINGNPCRLYLDKALYTTLEGVKKRVIDKNWDYVAIVGGIPGSGKSSFVRGVGRFLDPNFNEDNYCFSAEEFVKKANEVPEYSCLILDESFESLNARVTQSKGFQKIINHLQLIRQRHLFIFLCLPNFFDLSKGIAVFRASHLFITYASNEGDRGKFMAFDRQNKRMLYVLGGRNMNYNAVRANFVGRYELMPHIFSEENYERNKLHHLMSQDKKENDLGEYTLKKRQFQIYQAIILFILELKRQKVVTAKALSEWLGCSSGTILRLQSKYKEIQSYAKFDNIPPLPAMSFQHVERNHSIPNIDTSHNRDVSLTQTEEADNSPSASS